MESVFGEDITEADTLIRALTPCLNLLTFQLPQTTTNNANNNQTTIKFSRLTISTLSKS